MEGEIVYFHQLTKCLGESLLMQYNYLVSCCCAQSCHGVWPVTWNCLPQPHLGSRVWLFLTQFTCLQLLHSTVYFFILFYSVLAATSYKSSTRNWEGDGIFFYSTMELVWDFCESEVGQEWKSTPVSPSTLLLSHSVCAYISDSCVVFVCVVCQEKDDPALSQNVDQAEQYFHNSVVECAIQSCPELLKKGTALTPHSSHTYS